MPDHPWPPLPPAAGFLPGAVGHVPVTAPAVGASPAPASCPASRPRQVPGDHRHLLALILDSSVLAPASIRTAAPATSAKRLGCTMVGLAGQLTLTLGGRPPG